MTEPEFLASRVMTTVMIIAWVIAYYKDDTRFYGYGVILLIVNIGAVVAKLVTAWSN
jgi:hypothetical protein